MTVKEGEKFQCEKDGVVKGFAIQEPEKYFKEISVPPHSEDERMLREIKRYIRDNNQIRVSRSIKDLLY